MRIEYAEGRKRFTQELLKNGDLTNPYSRLSENEKWLGFEQSKSDLEQQQFANDYQQGVMGV